MLEIADQQDIRRIRLNRPPVNALDGELIAALGKAIEEAPAQGARALVLAGRPGMFSAGLDLPALLRLDRSGIQAVWRDFFRMMRALAASPIPIAAAITGHSPAGGAVLAIYCDYRVMAEGPFKIGLNEVRVGIALPSSIYQAFERLVGPRQAEHHAPAGTLLDVSEAHRLGLVDEVRPVEQVEEQATAWLQETLALPPAAFSATRQIARRRLLEHLDAHSESDVEATLDSWFSDETQTTLRAVVASLGKK